MSADAGGRHSEGEKAARFSDWLRLLRLPNLFTAPGDPIAGFLLAGGALTGAGWRVAAVAAAAVCLYAAGLAMNDLFDLERDRRERGDRPLPSGRISKRAAVIATVLLDAAALGLARAAGNGALLAAAAVALLVFLYNSAARRAPAVGYLTMGCCRGGSVLLGAAAAGAFPALAVAAAATETGYVAAFSAAAAHETEGPPKGLRRWLPPVVLGVGMAVVVVLGGGRAAGMAACAAAVAVAALIAAAMRPGLAPERVSAQIGKLVRLLIPAQAGFVLAAGDFAARWLPALGIYALWPLAAWSGKRFRGS